MEKFRKLNRAEMKTVIGGAVLCPPDGYVACLCDNPQPDPCALVGDWTGGFCGTAFSICDDYCTSIGYNSIGTNGGCYNFTCENAYDGDQSC